MLLFGFLQAATAAGANSKQQFVARELLQQVCSSAPKLLTRVLSLPAICCRANCAAPLLLLLLSPLCALLPQALQKTTPLMRAQQAVKYTGQRTNFFSLLRFDLMLDENLDTYLIEVGSVCVWKG